MLVLIRESRDATELQDHINAIIGALAEDNMEVVDINFAAPPDGRLLAFIVADAKLEQKEYE